MPSVDLPIASTNEQHPTDIYRTDAHRVADLAARVPIARELEMFVQIKKLLDERYIGTSNGFTVPLHGKPATAIAGVRLKLGGTENAPRK